MVEQFSAQAKLQGFARLLNPNFDPNTLTDDDDIELWERQNNYLWNVLLLVFKQGLAKQTLY